MIQKFTSLNVADNSGAKVVKCIGIPSNSITKTVSLGDIITVVVKKAKIGGKIEKSAVTKAIIVRVIKERRRIDGSYIKFDENAVILLNDSYQSIGTRIFGPIAKELRYRRFTKLLSLASAIV